MNSYGKCKLIAEHAMRRALTVSAVCAFLTLLLPAGCAVPPQASPPSVKPGHARSYYQRGIYYGGRGEIALAIADYTMAIQIDSNFMEAYTKRGLANMGANWEASVRDFNKAIALSPGDHRLYFYRGDAHNLNEDIDRAIADCDRVIAMNPRSPEAYWSYYRRACWLESHGRIREAIGAYEEFIEKARSVRGQSTYEGSVVTGAFTGALVGSGGDPFAASVGLAAGLLPLLDHLDHPKPNVHKDRQAFAREKIAELREIEVAYQNAGGDVSLSSIAVGMNRRQVIARTLEDGYYVTLKPDVEVAVSRSGNIDVRILMVLRFQDEMLVAREDFSLSQLLALPETDVQTPSVFSVFAKQRREIEEELRQRGKIIFADEDLVAAIAYDSAAKGKRILVFNFSNGNLVSYGTRSRSLW